MRKTLPLLALLALSLPVAGMAGLTGPSTGEGTLSVEDGKGRIMIQARGGVIGRLDRGSVTIFDLTPEDANEPYVFGGGQGVTVVGENGIKYSGNSLRFRLIGGRYRIVIQGRGIDLSTVGKGWVWLKGDAGPNGVYSLEGDDCKKDRAACKALPELEKRFTLGAVAATDRAEKSLVRSTDG